MMQALSWLTIAAFALIIISAMNALYVDSLKRRIEELEK